MTLSSQSREALISVRLVVADHYMAAPVLGLDPLASPFTGVAIKWLPVIRLFGSTVSPARNLPQHLRPYATNLISF